jgi:hypothetical protein
MTMLDLGSSGTAFGVASAASGFVADPLAGADGVTAFCPPCEAVPPVAGVDGDAFGGVFWLEVEGATLGLVAEVPGLAFGGAFWPEVCGAALGLVAELPGLEGDAFGGVFWPEVAGAVLGLVAEVPGLEGAACPSGVVTGAVAPGAVAAAAPFGLVSALAGKANTIAKNGTARRPRNCGKEAEKPICSTLVAQNPIARRPLDRAS